MTEQSLRYEVKPSAIDTGSNDTLLERLDDVLREASTGISESFAELVRQALSGGVQKIDDEVARLVENQVAGEVDRRMPDFKDTAARTAADEARVVSENAISAYKREAKVASDRAVESLNAVEKRMQGSIDHIRTGVDQWRGVLEDLQTRLELERTALRETGKKLTDTQSRLALLEAQIAELQKPRGLGAFLSRLFGSKPQESHTSESPESSSAPTKS